MKTSPANQAGAIQLINISGLVWAISILIFGVGLLRAGVPAETNDHGAQVTAGPDWSEPGCQRNGKSIDSAQTRGDLR